MLRWNWKFEMLEKIEWECGRGGTILQINLSQSGPIDSIVYTAPTSQTPKSSKSHLNHPQTLENWNYILDFFVLNSPTRVVFLHKNKSKFLCICVSLCIFYIKISLYTYHSKNFPHIHTAVMEYLMTFCFE